MGSRLVAAAVAAALLTLPLAANAQAKSPREASCQAQAGQKGLQGRERQRFMIACLGAKTGKPAAKKAPVR